MPSIPGAGRRQRNNQRNNASSRTGLCNSLAVPVFHPRPFKIASHWPPRGHISRVLNTRGRALTARRRSRYGALHFSREGGPRVPPRTLPCTPPQQSSVGHTHFAWNVPHRHIHPFFTTDCWCADEGGVLLSIVLMQRNSMAHLGWTSTYSTSSKQSISKKSDRWVRLSDPLISVVVSVRLCHCIQRKRTTRPVVVHYATRLDCLPFLLHCTDGHHSR